MDPFIQWVDNLPCGIVDDFVVKPCGGPKGEKAADLHLESMSVDELSVYDGSVWPRWEPCLESCMNKVAIDSRDNGGVQGKHLELVLFLHRRCAAGLLSLL